MEEMEPLQNKQVWPVDTRDGRLGPAKVCLDTTSHVGLFVFGEDQLSVMSQSNFSTIRANACLYRGNLATLEVLKPRVFHMPNCNILNLLQLVECGNMRTI
jgi:hypothetical protein